MEGTNQAQLADLWPHAVPTRWVRVAQNESCTLFQCPAHGMLTSPKLPPEGASSSYCLLHWDKDALCVCLTTPAPITASSGSRPGVLESLLLKQPLAQTRSSQSLRMGCVPLQKQFLTSIQSTHPSLPGSLPRPGAGHLTDDKTEAWGGG